MTCLKILQLGSCCEDRNSGLKGSKRNNKILRAAGRWFTTAQRPSLCQEFFLSWALWPDGNPGKITFSARPEPALVSSARLLIAHPEFSSSVTRPHPPPSPGSRKPEPPYTCPGRISGHGLGEGKQGARRPKSELFPPISESD